MIDALFTQPNYLAVKKMLDVTALRMEAAASNLANVETPGYRRVDVAKSFETRLQEALRSGNPAQVGSLRPTLAPDPDAVVQRPDGNTVDLESEMVGMYQTSIEHAAETQFLTGALLKMKMAITGRPS